MEIGKLEKNSIYFNEVLETYYKWWGEEKNKSLDDIKKEYEDYDSTPYPIIYILTSNNELVGIYEINEHDDLETELSPFLANVYIKEKYRKKGYSKLLIEHAKNLYNPLYLHSRIENYYEKFNFSYIGNIDSIYGIKRVYKYQDRTK